MESLRFGRKKGVCDLGIRLVLLLAIGAIV